MKKKYAVTAAALAVCGLAFGFDLKGLKLGDKMDGCPLGAQIVNRDRPDIRCKLGQTTLARQPAKALEIGIYEGKVYSIVYTMQEKGKGSNTYLADSLIERFGPPTSEKSHIDQYMWVRGKHFMSLDGFDGVLVLMDSEVHDRIRKVIARENNVDL